MQKSEIFCTKYFDIRLWNIIERMPKSLSHLIIPVQNSLNYILPTQWPALHRRAPNCFELHICHLSSFLNVNEICLSENKSSV